MSARASAEVDPVEALSATVAQLRAERDGLRRAMRNRAVIEQAKGLLVERMGISPQGAFEHLVELSSHHNVKLVELAASLVANRAPGPAAPPEMVTETGKSVASREKLVIEVDEPGGDELGGATDQPAGDDPKRTVDESRAEPGAPPVDATQEALRSQHQLLSGRIGSAVSFSEIASAILESNTGWPHPDAVMVLAVQADRALRLVGSAGLTAEVRSQWERVPPIEELPIVVAVQSRVPVFDAPEPGDDSSLLALPLIHKESVLGVVAIFWEAPVELDDDARAYLLALGEPCARRYVKLSDSGQRPPVSGDSDGGDSSNVTVLPLLVEALHRPAVVLAPVYDDAERVIDFRPESGSPAARELARAEHLTPGVSLLQFLPQLGSQLLIPALVEVLRTGSSIDLDEVWISADREGTRESYMVDLHAARLWDKVLVTWRVHTDQQLLHEQLLLTERVCEAGSFQWDRRTDVARWSPGLYRLVGRRPSDGPVTLADIGAYVDPEDLSGLPALIKQTISVGKVLETDVRGAGRLRGRHLGIFIEPVLDEAGIVQEVRGVLRDLTDSWAAMMRLRQAEVKIAAQWAHDRSSTASS